MSDLEKFVRDAISRYVAGIFSLEELGQRLPDAWDLDQVDDRETRRLVMLVVGYISDYERDHLTEAELRARLADEASWRLERVAATVNPLGPPPRVETGVHAGANTALREALSS